MKTVYNKNDVEIAYKKIKKHLLDLLENNNFGLIGLIGLDHISFITTLQGVFEQKFESEVENQLYMIILEYAIKSEKLAPGSFDLTIKKIINNKFEINLNNTSTVATIENYLDYVKKHFLDKNNDIGILEDAINLVGKNGKILIEKSNNEVESIELTSGYTFNCDIKSKNYINTTHNNVKVICIDGYIESVSEFHNFLYSVSQSKDLFVIFARGYDDDVINTINVNNLRNSFRVVPVIMKFDMEGINILNDISVITKSHMLSSNLGDDISRVTDKDASIVNKISFYDGKVVIQNPYDNYVKAHIKFLSNKRDELKEDTIRELYNRRIKSLYPQQVIIRLRDDSNFVIRSQFFDYSLRVLSSIIQYGINDETKELFTTYYYSNYYAKKCIELLNNIGAVVYN